MLIGLAQVNSYVGDIDKNVSLIIDYIELGRSKFKLDTIIFPELVLSGYPPEDLLYRPAFHKRINDALNTISKKTIDINLIFGYPRLEGNTIYNSCVVMSNGKSVGSYDKMALPNYGVFDEKRYFDHGTTSCLVDLNGIKAGLSICEDIWSPEPLILAMEAGAELIININASPFHKNKTDERRLVLQDRIKETGIPIIYVNQIGGQDELVFDGGSMIMDENGKVIFQAPQFEENLYVAEINKKGHLLEISAPKHTVEKLSHEEIIYKALVLAVRDYVNKNGFKGVVIGLSGGIDSALVACIACDALGNENVEVIMMPSRFTSEMSIDDSKQLSNTLNISHRVISIDNIFSSFVELLKPVFNNLPEDATEENIQARCRGIILMAVSNKSHKLVLATSNKSEMAVGYSTLYGDMVGGYAPLKDTPKLLVYQLAKWRNTQELIIPERIISRPPTAELRDNQKDEDSLPSYDVLDPILERYIERDQSPQQIIQEGFNEKDVYRVIRMVDLNEYKRRQAAPGVKISKRAFGRERRYPITSGYREE